MATWGNPTAIPAYARTILGERETVTRLHGSAAVATLPPLPLLVRARVEPTIRACIDMPPAQDNHDRPPSAGRGAAAAASEHGVGKRRPTSFEKTTAGEYFVLPASSLSTVPSRPTIGMPGGNTK